MKRLALAFAILVASLSAAAAQSPCSKYIVDGRTDVLTASQWNWCFSAKQDSLGYIPLNASGGVVSGRVVFTAPSGTRANLNLTPGTAPSAPSDGDIWVTSTDINARINGATVTLLSPDITNITGLGTGVATALGINIGSSGAVVTNGGALGTPSSGVATNLTGTASGLTAGHVTTNANLTGAVTSVGNVTTIPSGSAVLSYNTRTGAVTATGTDIPLRSYLAGLTLSTAGSSTTFGIAAGVATDSTNVSMMALASAYTKTTGSWAVGSGNGALDTGSIAASTWYHVFLIKRLDTGVVDVLISTSPTSPTLPANYTVFRRIGSMITNGSSQWTSFSQNGDEFLRDAIATDASSVATSASASSVTLSVPSGIVVNALLSLRGDYVSASTSILVTSLSVSDQAPSTAAQSVTVTSTATLGSAALNVRTDTSRNIRIRATTTGASYSIGTFGWIDRRGRDN